MAFWLLKTEPDNFSYSDLEQLGRERWNGVKSFIALGNIRKMQPGDEVFIYHTGKEKSIIGVGEVITQPYPDPEQADTRLIVVDIAPCYRLRQPVTLKEVKSHVEFQDWDLTKQPRLSVMPVTDVHWRLVHQLAGH